MLKVKKRDGSVTPFDQERIKQAVLASGGTKATAVMTSQRVTQALLSRKEPVSVYEIESMVIVELTSQGHKDIAHEYREYKDSRAKQRNTIIADVSSIINGTNEEVAQENSNKFAERLVTQVDLVAEDISKRIYLNTMIPNHAKEAHESGIIYIHDTGKLAFSMYNCNLIDMESCLLEGTVMNNVLVEPQTDFTTACTVATQIVAGVSANQFGGTTTSTLPLAKVLRKHSEKIRKSYDEITDEVLREKYIQRDINAALRTGVQTINYQLNTLGASANQSPFVTIFMYMSEDVDYEYENRIISEEIIRQRRDGVKNEDGFNISLAFPKLILVLEDRFFDGSTDEFDTLVKVSSECVAKRLVPDFISEKNAKELYEGQVIPPMGCRSFLSPWKDENGNKQLYGRMNLGVYTINLPDIALTVHGDIEKFFELLDERLLLIKELFELRINFMKQTSPDVSPLHYRHGVIARLPKDVKTIESLITKRTSISLGYIGLNEVCYALIGESLTSEKGQKLVTTILTYLRSWTDAVGDELNIGAGLYGTPGESALSNLREKTIKRFGIVENVTDKPYFTNSFHVDVNEPIDAFSKLSLEAQWANVSRGGNISYVETNNLNNNLEAITDIMAYINDHSHYAEINTKSDVCFVCGSNGEMSISDDLGWSCPQCGNADQKKMQVLRRTCGLNGSH